MAWVLPIQPGGSSVTCRTVSVERDSAAIRSMIAPVESVERSSMARISTGTDSITSRARRVASMFASSLQAGTMTEMSGIACVGLGCAYFGSRRLGMHGRLRSAERTRAVQRRTMSQSRARRKSMQDVGVSAYREGAKILQALVSQLYRAHS